MEKRYLIVVLAILVAYGVTFFNNRHTGAASNAASFADVLKEQGDIASADVFQQDEVMPENPEETYELGSILPLLGQPTEITIFPEGSRSFIAVLHKLASTSTNQEPASSLNIDKMFMREVTVFPTNQKLTRPFLQAIR